MSAPEISLAAFFKPYRKYWWVLLAVFVGGAVVGFLLPSVFRFDISMAEFSIPIVVREQYSPNWDVTDEDALISFVRTWLNHEWQTRISDPFPDARSQVVLKKDTYVFNVEQDAPFDDLALLEDISVGIYQDFQTQFITSTASPWWELIQNEGCLTDAANPANVVCFPISETLQNSGPDTYDLASLLWLGEKSPVTTHVKLPYARFLQAAALGIMAECVLLMVVLLQMSWKEH